MKKLFLIINAIFTFAIFANAQGQSERGSISGSIIDDTTKESISEANVRILAQKDSAFVTGIATNKDGTFAIPIRNGQYIVQISYIGYADVYKETAVTGRMQHIKLGTISLKDDGILLSDALITAKAPEIVVKGDTVEYNADSYKITESAVIEDLLKKCQG